MQFALRRERLQQIVREQNLDGLLVSNPHNVAYLTGFSGEASHLLVGLERVLLVSDGRFSEQLAEECPDVPVHIRPPQVRLFPATASCLEDLGWRRIGIEAAHVTLAEAEVLRGLLPAAAWHAVRDAVESLRIIKDADEVAALRQAIGQAERAFAQFLQQLRPEESERQLHHRMEWLVRQAGSRHGSFPAIIAVGSRAALPHAPPTERCLADQELILIDWGARDQFYVSDLTRVLTVRRRRSTRFIQVYQAVLQAQSKAIAALRPGVTAREVDAVARGSLEADGFGPAFTHGLGHGLGLEVHEAPFLRADNAQPLQAGMVVTVEPGVYLPGWGGVRIEDDVLLTPEGPVVLTSVPKDLDAITIDF